MRPKRLGRYELLRHLAAGGMAQVFLARATGPGGFARHVVVKTIPPERRDDDSFVAMFLDEARLVALLHHQHIGQVFEVGQADDGSYFLAMEYVHGETVRAVLEVASQRKHRLPLELSLSVGCAAAAALHHAHERRDLDGTPLGIVHRDVSPSNVVLGYDGAIKLIDFGIAKARLRATETAVGFVKGKAGYMAPEQARGGEVDRRSDVFALGVLAYELTTQTRAFHAESQLETMRRTMHGEIEPPSRRVAGYPPELEDIVMTALALDPDDRFQDAEAMRVAFEQIARELGLPLGDTAVIRTLETLFPARPEPWLADEPDDEETTAVRDGSEPIIMIVPPRTPTKVRLARGTETPEANEVADEVSGRPSPSGDVATEPFERALPARERMQLAELGRAPAVARDPAAPLPRRHPTPLTVKARAVSGQARAVTGQAHPPTVRPHVPSRPPTGPMRAEEPPLRPARSVTGPMPAEDLPLRPPLLTPVPPMPVLDASSPTIAITSAPAIATSSPTMAITSAPAIATSSPAIAVTTSPASEIASSPTLVGTPPPPPTRRSTYRLRAARLSPRVRVIAGVGLTLALIVGIVVALALTGSPSSHEPASPPARVGMAPPSPAPPPAPRSPVVPPPAPSGHEAAATTVVLHVTTEPAGATVVLDGVRLGITPFEASVPKKPGGAWLKVRMKHFIPVKTRVSLDAGVDWDVTLRRLSHE